MDNDGDDDEDEDNESMTTMNALTRSAMGSVGLQLALYVFRRCLSNIQIPMQVL